MVALHDLNLAAKFCDRLLMLREGKFLAERKPDEILTLAEIGETYRVVTHLEQTSRGNYYADTRLP